MSEINFGVSNTTSLLAILTLPMPLTEVFSSINLQSDCISHFFHRVKRNPDKFIKRDAKQFLALHNLFAVYLRREAFFFEFFLNTFHFHVGKFPAWAHQCDCDNKAGKLINAIKAFS